MSAMLVKKYTLDHKWWMYDPQLEIYHVGYTECYYIHMEIVNLQTIHADDHIFISVHDIGIMAFETLNLDEYRDYVSSLLYGDE